MGSADRLRLAQHLLASSDGLSGDEASTAALQLAHADAHAPKRRAGNLQLAKGLAIDIVANHVWTYRTLKLDNFFAASWRHATVKL